MVFDLASALGNLREPNMANEIDFSGMDSAELKGTINGLVDQVTASSECITASEVFDTFQSLLNCLSSLPATAISSILDVLLSAFESEITSTSKDANPTDHAAYRTHKPALEAYAFLLLWFVQAAEKLGGSAGAVADGTTVTTLTAGKRGAKGKGKGKGKNAAAVGGNGATFDWTGEIPAVLEVMAKALRLKTEFIWQTTPERDAFVSCFTKAAYQLAESDTYMKIAEIRNPIFKVICVAAKSHGQALSTQTSIMQSLQYSEHLSDPMAELVHILNMTFDLPQIGDALLRDLASKHFSAQDTKGPRSFSRFLIKLAELSPRLVLKQIVVLKKHLDSEAYPMRNALLEVIGKLIRELSSEGSREEAQGRDAAAAGSGDREELGQGGEKDEEMQKRQVEGFWELLLERFADSNTYVRSKVVAVCEEILGFPAKFPSQRLLLARLACRSLEDKSSQVRKHCITVFIKLIETHPYGLMHGGELDREGWTARYEGVVKELEALALPSMEELAQQEQEGAEASDESKAEDGEGAEEGEGEEEEAGEEEEEDEDASESSSAEGTPRPRRVKKYKGAKNKSKPRKSDMDLAAIGQQEALAHLDQNKLAWLRLQKKYYADALTFIEILERAMPHIQKLLASKTKSEVLESINFFKTATKYKVEGSESGVRRMLHLVWSKDNSTVEDGKEVKGVRHALIDCYRDLYFAPTVPEENETPAAYAKRNIDRITRNMIELTYGATLAELTSLEQLMAIMMEQDNVPDDVVSKLWQVYSTSKDIPRDQRRGAIMVLGMLAAPKPEVVTDNLDKVISIGLGAIGKADLVLAKYSCIALRRIGGSAKKVKGSLADKNVRLPMDNPIFQRLSDAIQNPTTSKDWFAMAEQAVNTIYGLGDQPDALCSQIIRQMTVRVFGPSANGAETSADDETPAEVEAPVAPSRASSVAPTDIDGDVPGSQSSQAAYKPGSATADAFQLSQVIFVAGHCAIKQLVHLELVEREFKRRKADSEKKGPAGEAAGEELDQVAGNVEDDIGDIIAHTKEKELLYGPDSLLAIFGPMTVQICGLPKVYKNQTLRTAATLSLSKFMCVSAEFCEQHLMLLFKVLETSKDPAIRSNIIIALGDIAVCFATIMDQNSDRLYAGLTDHDLTVKKNTLMVLTHLILNGMIKVKGQLGEMAKCLEDEEERISDLARLFFTELSTKDNAIYNNLPDIISHLSVGKHAVKEESFRSTMSFIFTFLEKEKQAESIIDKLCQRFRLVAEPRQWQDIAYCLSLLPYKSERTVKKLVDGLPFYQDKLYEPEVFKCFQDILVKARGNKATKNESDLAEFEAALEQHKAKGEDDAAMEAKVQKKKAKAAKATKKKPARRQRRASTPLSSDGEY